MGEILESCECRTPCCNKNKDNLENNTQEESEEEEEYDEQEQFGGGIVNKSTKDFYRLPSDIINMKVKANNIIGHKTNPWSVYKELEEIGFGTYGVVKKVCLIDNPDIIRAIKIIPKENLIEGYDEDKLSNEIFILKKLKALP